MRALARRVARIEAANLAGTARPIPSTIFVRANETKAEAVARFNTEWPNRPHDHRALIVPAKPRTEAEQALWAERFHENQSRLVANARRERIAIAKADSPATAIPPKLWPSSSTIRPNGPHIVWKPQC